jgi:hypothetical protein
MSIEKPVVWVAFVTINLGDHDEFRDFLSVHTTQEGAKKAVAEWTKDSEGEDFDPDLAGWVEDPNTGDAYYVGLASVTTYERIVAGDAEVFGTVDAKEVDG